MPLTAASSWTSHGRRLPTRARTSANVSPCPAWTTTVSAPQATNTCMPSVGEARRVTVFALRNLTLYQALRKSGLGSVPMPTPDEKVKGQGPCQRGAVASHASPIRKPFDTHGVSRGSARAAGQGIGATLHGSVLSSVGTAGGCAATRTLALMLAQPSLSKIFRSETLASITYFALRAQNSAASVTLLDVRWLRFAAASDTSLCESQCSAATARVKMSCLSSALQSKCAHT